MPKQKKTPRPKTPPPLTAENLFPIINSALVELRDFARSHANVLVDADSGDADLDAAIQALTDAFYEWQAGESLAEERTALVRLAALAVVLLAVDEHRRGENVIVGEMLKLDELGFPKSRSLLLQEAPPSERCERCGQKIDQRPVRTWIGTPPPGWKPGDPRPHVCFPKAELLPGEKVDFGKKRSRS